MKHHRLLWPAMLLAAFTASAQAQALPERIAKAKVIKIGVNPIYPPMEYKDPDSAKLIGFDVDLANALAKELGVAFTKADAPLRDAVLVAFKKLLANGTYAAIVTKWNLQTSAVKQAAVNGTPSP